MALLAISLVLLVDLAHYRKASAQGIAILKVSSMKRSQLLHSKINWDATLNLPKPSLPIKPSLNDDLYRETISTELYQQFASRSNVAEFNLTDGPPFANGDLHVGKCMIFCTIIINQIFFCRTCAE